MPAMTKRVNIYAPIAIRSVTPPIYGTCKDVTMTTGDILKCLCKRANVEEILPDGSTVKLNMRNYFTDNGAGLYNKKPINKSNKINKKEEPKEAVTIEEINAVIPEEPILESITADEINAVIPENDHSDKNQDTIKETTTTRKRSNRKKTTTATEQQVVETTDETEQIVEVSNEIEESKE